MSVGWGGVEWAEGGEVPSVLAGRKTGTAGRELLHSLWVLADACSSSEHQSAPIAAWPCRWAMLRNTY